MLRVIAYLVSIVAANVITASTMPIAFGIFLVPAGTFIVGLTFVLRDLVQNHLGKRRTYYTIATALIISAAVSAALGDTLMIVAASAVSFLVSESMDTEVYSRLPLSMAWRVAISGVIGGSFDSAIFVVIGLSPLGSGQLPWAAVPAAIVGQIIVKSVLQLIGAGVLQVVLSRKAQAAE
ncbi:VUT family protein [Lacticaseibacillus jixiensis]|uniref:VUT family protein n=1 Tax=Lacticaseibacillus jixiensis TaxID=3231926 RepID=UPI0036F2AB5C